MMTMDWSPFPIPPPGSKHVGDVSYSWEYAAHTLRVPRGWQCSAEVCTRSLAGGLRGQSVSVQFSRSVSTRRPIFRTPHVRVCWAHARSVDKDGRQKVRDMRRPCTSSQ